MAPRWAVERQGAGGSVRRLPLRMLWLGCCDLAACRSTCYYTLPCPDPASPILQGVVIVGHSTGCQDAVRYCQRQRGSAAAAPLLGAVLQAPVSDQDWLATQPGTAERIAAARQMAEDGRGEEVAFRAHDIDGAAMTARRWLSLAAPGGDDDMFSTHLSEARLAEIFAPMRGLPTLVLLSGEEEYIPGGLDDRAAVGGRLAQAIGPTARLQVVEGASHALNGREEEGAGAIADFIASLPAAVPE